MGQSDDVADATLKITRNALDRMNAKSANLDRLITEGVASVSGDAAASTDSF